MSGWTLPEIQQRLTDLVGAMGETERGRTSRRILESATQHFVRFGYRRANVGRIAADAGVGKGTIYLHFENKRTLLLACIALEKRTLLPEFERVLALPEDARLEAFLEMSLRFVLTQPLHAALLSGDTELQAIMEDFGHELDEDRTRGEDFLAGLIASSAPQLSDGQRASLVEIVRQVVQLSAHLLDTPDLIRIPLDTFASTYAKVLARGIANLEAT